MFGQIDASRARHNSRRDSRGRRIFRGRDGNFYALPILQTKVGVTMNVFNHGFCFKF